MTGLRERFLRKDCTYLCVGPMSKNCVDAAIELAHDYRVPLMLIASRRQVECLELGGGYANNWDTFSFAEYVRRQDPQGMVILARDHGGPWQHPKEFQLFVDVDDAMESAKLSYLRDIEAGFQVLHIDPVVSLGDASPSLDWVMDKVYELYAYCMDVSRTFGREILIELGTEEQQEAPMEDPKNLALLLDRVIAFCRDRGYQPPAFMVVQTGTKVMGRRNIGDFPSQINEIREYVVRHRLGEIIEICNSRNIMLKEHNTDYLPDVSLSFHPQIGVHAANVAPEFGVAETAELLKALMEEGMDHEVAELVALCVASKKWDKWVLPNEEVSDLEKTLISGHYMFMNERVCVLKQVLDQRLSLKGEGLDLRLKNAVKRSIFRYMKCFNLI